MKICPNPISWNKIFERLLMHAEKHQCVPTTPPVPFILAGWAYSNDVEKMQKWQDTVCWASDNGCEKILSEVPDSDFYWVEHPNSYEVGPLGGPMYRSWDFEAKQNPSPVQLEKHFMTLISQWSEIVGTEIGRVSHPQEFSGDKSRRLIVRVNGNSRPPWGSWLQLSKIESERRKFTAFRAAINKAIAPHEIDHVEFI